MYKFTEKVKVVVVNTKQNRETKREQKENKKFLRHWSAVKCINYKLTNKTSN